MRPLLVLLALYSVQALDNGLGTLPIMGWSSWNAFGCSPAMNETSIRKIADFVVSSGLKDAGYSYVNLDDCMVEVKRDASGKLVPDQSRFPSGFKSLSDYIHSKGLKFGVYTDRGTHTCAGRAGAFGHEAVDAQTYVEWGVDFVKDDSCNDPPNAPPTDTLYARMRDGINATGKAMFLNIKEDLYPNGFAGAGDLANSWRCCDDIKPDPIDIGRVMDALDALAPYGRPGAFNDGDSLEVGNPTAAGSQWPGLNLDQQRAHFQLWCIATVQLVAGFDFSIKPEELAILAHKPAIGVNQDPLGVPGRRVRFSREGRLETWAKPLSTGAFAVVLWNRNNCDSHYGSSTTAHAVWAELGFAGNASVKDLWTGEPLGTFNGYFMNSSIPVNASQMLEVTPIKDQSRWTETGVWGRRATQGVYDDSFW